jgi:hypothetical protein
MNEERGRQCTLQEIFQTGSSLTMIFIVENKIGKVVSIAVLYYRRHYYQYVFIAKNSARRLASELTLIGVVSH